MTTAVLGRAEKVREESRRLDPAKVALTLLMVLPYVLGWTARKICKLVWLVVSVLWTAMVVGWRDAGGEHGGS
jgi:hypothetical protein